MTRSAILLVFVRDSIHAFLEHRAHPKLPRPHFSVSALVHHKPG